MTLWRIKAPFYSRMRRLPPFSLILQQERKQLVKLLQQIDISRNTHLDLGSGSGDTLTLFSKYETQVCVDASLAMLQYSPAAVKVLARAECLPFGNHCFDFVTSIGLLEYIADAEKFLTEVKRVLKSGGFFLFTSTPPKVANQLRLILGERLYCLSEKEVMMLLHKSGWVIRGAGRSWMQQQWLAQAL